MPQITRKRIGASLVIITSLLALGIPFIFHAPTIGAKPPGGGATTPPGPVTQDGDFQLTPYPDTLTIDAGQSATAKVKIESLNNFHDNIIITSTADQGLTITQDTSTVDLSTEGSVNITLTVTVEPLTNQGHHAVSVSGTSGPLSHAASLSIEVSRPKPEVSDLIPLISNSDIDNNGIINALLSKVDTAQHQFDTGHDLNGLHALYNQISAMTEKHGLDQQTANSILALIAAIQSGATIN